MFVQNISEEPAMKPDDEITAWVLSCFTTLRRSQQKTLGALVEAAVRVHHVTLAAPGPDDAGTGPRQAPDQAGGPFPGQ